VEGLRKLKGDRGKILRPVVNELVLHCNTGQIVKTRPEGVSKKSELTSKVEDLTGTRGAATRSSENTTIPKRANEAAASCGSGQVLSSLFEDITEAWEEAEASGRKKQSAEAQSEAHARFATTMRIRDLHDHSQSEVVKERVFALDGCKVPFQDADGHEIVELLTMGRLMSDVESGLIELEEVVPATAGAFTVSRPSELSDGDVQKLVDKIMSAPDDYRLMMPPGKGPPTACSPATRQRLSSLQLCTVVRALTLRVPIDEAGVADGVKVFYNERLLALDLKAQLLVVSKANKLVGSDACMHPVFNGGRELFGTLATAGCGGTSSGRGCTDAQLTADRKGLPMISMSEYRQQSIGPADTGRTGISAVFLLQFPGENIDCTVYQAVQLAYSVDGLSLSKFAFTEA
jgi:hypothetical protein